MKTPFRELRLHRGLVELVKAPQRLREATVVAPEHTQNGRAATASWNVREAFVKPPWLLAAPPWSLRGAFAELWHHLGATGNSSK